MAQLLPARVGRIKGKHALSAWLPGLALCLMLAGQGALAAQDGESLELRVARVVSGDSFQAEGGEEIKLAYIAAPAPPPDSAEGLDWPPATAAQRTLARLLDGQAVTLRPADDARDRYGRLSGLVYLADGRLLQTELLRAGQARIVVLPVDHSLSDVLLSAERTARRRKLGLWSHPYYRIRPADPARVEPGRYQLIIGRLVSANRVRNGAYLNFGRHWKSDVTVKLDKTAAASLEEKLGAVETLGGRRVLVRGWVERRDGPLIEVSDARLIELIEEAEQAAPSR